MKEHPMMLAWRELEAYVATLEPGDSLDMIEATQAHFTGRPEFLYTYIETVVDQRLAEIKVDIDKGKAA